MGTSPGKKSSQSQSGPPARPVPEAADVYKRFAALIAIAHRHFGGELGGKLLLLGQLSATAAAVSLAANIAGAATLGVDADAERLRQGIRHGFCDFVVNSLDEALRILKNELRKKQPVSVWLEGDLAATLREAVERGLQPDLLALTEKYDAAEILIQRGGLYFNEDLSQGGALLEITWSAESGSALWLSRVDAIAAEVLRPGDERLRWLKFAPRYLGRAMAMEHRLQMSVEEVGQFEQLVGRATDSGAIGTKITIQRREPSPR